MSADEMVALLVAVGALSNELLALGLVFDAARQEGEPAMRGKLGGQRHRIVLPLEDQGQRRIGDRHLRSA